MTFTVQCERDPNATEEMYQTYFRLAIPNVLEIEVRGAPEIICTTLLQFLKTNKVRIKKYLSFDDLMCVADSLQACGMKHEDFVSSIEPHNLLKE